MPISAGTKLGSYEITGPIGAGGMGEVYRARDTKLDREVAIKVLPEKFAEDTERLARFEREAKLLASLNHPNIASIYGFEQNALVLELVEGPTLAERIQKGQIPIEEALTIAKQIAEALEAGHEAGIIHRDLKPANVKVREDGTVKVLDYGLAKALEGDAPPILDSELSQSPTLTRLRQPVRRSLDEGGGSGGQARHGTQMGVILGTAAYMSPEQAKGKRVDKRTDVWAFGAVVYEMLTGKRAFVGDDVSDTLAAVLRAKPDLEALPAETPESLRLVLRLCLNKDVKERFQSIGDVRLAMKGAFEAHGATPTTIGWRPSIGMAAAAALLLSIVASVAVWRLKPPEEAPRPVTRFSLPLPPGVSLTGTGRQVVALSSDGTRIAFGANDQLYLRAMDQMTATPVQGTEGARSPFFSPDGEWIGFYAGRQLKKVAIRGGAPVTLCDINYGGRAQWRSDDTIVFGKRGAGILRVSADGGTPEMLVPLAETNAIGHGPQVLPGDKAVLFTLGDGTSWDTAQIVVDSLETGARKVLIEGGRDALYVPTGHIVYVLDETLLARPFDVAKLEVTGGPITMAEGVRTSGQFAGAAQYSVSDTGALVYVREGLKNRTLVWVDRNGRGEALAVEPRAFGNPRISPDGRRLALDIYVEENDIWIWDFDRETMTRLTLAPGGDSWPAWTPDGKRLAFSSSRAGEMDLYWKAADGSGAAERLLEREGPQFPIVFTPDGKQLVFLELTRRRADLGVLSLNDSSQPLLATELIEANPDLSPDGRWLAYDSDSSGQQEVYVRPFPNVEDGQWLISSGGGTRPVWSPNRRELFYLSPGGKLMAVDVETEPEFVPGRAVELFGGYVGAQQRGRTYDISPDGERFLMMKEDVGADAAAFVLVLNWFEELKRLVPTDN